MATRRKAPEPDPPEWSDAEIAFREWEHDRALGHGDPHAYVLIDDCWIPRDHVRIVAPGELRTRRVIPKPARGEPAPSYLTLAEASALIRTPSETIRYWIWQGRIEAFKPGRSVLVSESDLLALVAGNETVAKRARKMRKPKA